MARKGDIESKSVASRVPMEVYLRLLKNSSSNGKTLSSYLCDVLSDEKFGQGGQTKIEYQDRWSIDTKLVTENNLLKSKIKEIHKDWVDIVKDNHKEINKLKEENELLKIEVKEWKDKYYRQKEHTK